MNGIGLRELEFAEADCTAYLIAGTDEAGRGPLAGDVVAAAVILEPGQPIAGINDSKQLTAAKREILYEQIIQVSLDYGVGRCNAEEIDQMNILNASLTAMCRAVDGLKMKPELVYVDGNRCPVWDYQSKAIIKGDTKFQCIAAASILAKVIRDRDMLKIHEEYPGYGFAQHKGYPTKLHMEAIEKLGPCPYHRRSFKPVNRLL